MCYLNVPETPWYFIFTTIDHYLKLKTHFIPNISFKKQIVRKDKGGYVVLQKMYGLFAWSLQMMDLKH